LINQFTIFDELKRLEPHEHKGFHSNAHVPGGMYCTDCEAIVIRDIPPLQNEPDDIGYITANWAWKYKHGNEWTKDEYTSILNLEYTS